jgi:hypothetical protein
MLLEKLSYHSCASHQHTYHITNIPHPRDQLNANVEAKRLHYGPNNPAFKGHDRDEKHGKDMESAIESRASASLGVDLTPQEEDRLNKTGASDADLDKIVQARETKQV